MFRGLINDAKMAAGSMIAKYLARASVALPFLLALGFATAAITSMLVERFGSIAGYWMVAGGLTLIGLVAALVVGVKEQEEEEVAEKRAEASDTAEVGADAAAQAAVQMPLAALGALLSTPGGATAAVGGAKTLVRNLPLVVLLALISLLFWPSESAAADQEEGEFGMSNGTCTPAGADMHREAA